MHGQRSPARAVELAKASVRNDPGHTTAWHALGLAHCMAGSSEEAIAAVEKSIELTGVGDALNWFVRSMARWQMGDEVGARRDYALAIDWLASDVSHTLPRDCRALSDGGGARSWASQRSPHRRASTRSPLARIGESVSFRVPF